MLNSLYKLYVLHKKNKGELKTLLSVGFSQMFPTGSAAIFVPSKFQPPPPVNSTHQGGIWMKAQILSMPERPRHMTGGQMTQLHN